MSSEKTVMRGNCLARHHCIMKENYPLSTVPHWMPFCALLQRKAFTCLQKFTALPCKCVATFLALQYPSECHQLKKNLLFLYCHCCNQLIWPIYFATGLIFLLSKAHSGTHVVLRENLRRAGLVRGSHLEQEQDAWHRRQSAHRQLFRNI